MVGASRSNQEQAQIQKPERHVELGKGNILGWVQEDAMFC